MTQRLITYLVTVLVLIVCGVYEYLTIHGGGEKGAAVPVTLYVLYISMIYRERLGFTAALLGGGFLFINKPTILLDGLLLFVFLFLSAAIGTYAGKYLRAKNWEIRKRDIYSSAAAHELKTPLTVMRLRVSQLAKKDPALEQILEKEIDRIQSLIERMLNYAKISSGKFRLVYKSFSLTELVKEVTANVQNVSYDANIVKHVPKEDICITADKAAIEQILINLLVNAVKHGHDKLIDVTLRRKNKQWVQIEIKDRGDGIPKFIRTKLFAPFVQGSNSSPGLGMGLYIVRQLVDLHKGLVYFNSRKKGTTFFVDLPISPDIKDKRGKYRI